MTYGAFKRLTKVAASDKVLYNKEFWIPKDPNLDDYRAGFTFTDYDFLI